MYRFMPWLAILVLLGGRVSPAQSEEPPDYVLQWGSEGTGPGEFNDPAALAFAPNGDLYVVDQKNNRIQRFDSEGTFLSMFGGPGRGEGEFDNAIGIAVDAAGNIYVADWGNHRIQKFDPAGNFQTMWGNRGSDPGQFIGPVGVALDGNGNVYVADQFNNRVQKFDSNGGFLTLWGSPDRLPSADPGGFAYPRYVASSGNNLVYVSDHTNRIQMFTDDGSYISYFGSTGSGETQFQSPLGLTVDAGGNVYVAEGGNHRIQKLTADGMFLWQMGRRAGEVPVPGGDPGQFNRPLDVKVHPDRSLYVADTQNQRIQKFGMVVAVHPTTWGRLKTLYTSSARTP